VPFPAADLPTVLRREFREGRDDEVVAVRDEAEPARLQVEEEEDRFDRDNDAVAETDEPIRTVRHRRPRLSWSLLRHYVLTWWSKVPDLSIFLVPDLFL